MTILYNQKIKRGEDHGYVGTFLKQFKDVAKSTQEKNIKIVSNAGGLNPKAMALEVEKIIDELNLKLKVAYIEGDDLMIPAQQSLRINQKSPGIPKIDDAPWPGFPADLTSIMTVVATQCKGTVLIFEKMFESRLFWVDKLISMGAQILLCDPHRAVVSGPSKLQGMPVSSPDIRAGMALLIAALCAKGESIIQNVHQIDRGYERIDERLRRLGADIERVDY